MDITLKVKYTYADLLGPDFWSMACMGQCLLQIQSIPLLNGRRHRPVLPPRYMVQLKRSVLRNRGGGLEGLMLVKAVNNRSYRLFSCYLCQQNQAISRQSLSHCVLRLPYEPYHAPLTIFPINSRTFWILLCPLFLLCG